MENAKIEKFKCDILGDFQTLCKKIFSYLNLHHFVDPWFGILSFTSIFLAMFQLEHRIQSQFLYGSFFIRDDSAILRSFESFLLSPGTTDAYIVQVGRVSLDLVMVVAHGTLHPELVDGRGVVHPDLLLLGVEPDPHAHVESATLAPDIVGHLKADDEDAQVDLAGAFAEGVGALPLVEAAFVGVIVGRVPLVHAFTFSHFERLKF